MSLVSLLSPAKINLYLRIINKRLDGYHNIVSVIQPISLFDNIQIDIGSGNEIKLETKGFHILKGQHNTAYAAAKLFLQESGIKKSIRISIKKNIPPGSGMGGGSSNAAAVLVGLNKLFSSYLTHDKLVEIATKIGADVPFFIKCKTSLVEGIGERITPLSDFPLFHYVIIYPRINVSTQHVYQKWDALEENKPLETAHTTEEIADLISKFKKEELSLLNDLEPATFKLHAEIFKYKELLHSLCKEPVLMTGSGSAVYTVFREETKAREIYNHLKNLRRNIDIFIAKGIHSLPEPKL